VLLWQRRKHLDNLAPPVELEGTMPELPEVESLSLALKEVLGSGRKILRTLVFDSKLGSLDRLAGDTLYRPERIGKGLYFPLAGGDFLQVHLRMTGRLLHHSLSREFLRYERLRLEFEEGVLSLLDPRRFATVMVVETIPQRRALDIVKDQVTAEELWERGLRKGTTIKSFLLDQSILAGIGDIYASEILHRAGIDPRRAVSSLSLTEWKAILNSASAILGLAISCRGTTISDWRDLFGRPGGYQRYLKVYGREGKPCFRCGQLLKRLKIGGRSTYFCQVCQK